VPLENRLGCPAGHDYEGCTEAQALAAK
jgi:hypothetical protein